ncbi:MAG: class I SAM-dependent methyltransferase [Vicinamibacterales bacterium]|jgi:SAM-dependent methyltransferase|nr:class I SAM-dependent methyltransferase [Vicinamibacterales bacterium]
MSPPHALTPAAGTRSEYDTFADIYTVWTDTARSTRANLPFYVKAYAAADGPVVELGVGDGRIAVEAAAQGCHVIGVDASPAMLALCRQRAQRAGVTDHITLLEADFRDFELQEPAALIALPYHSIGHLLTLDDKRQAMRHIFAHVRPGGRFVFDDFLMTPALMAHMQQVQLRAAYRSTAGVDMLLWVASLVDEPSKSMTVVTWEDELDVDGRLDRRRYRRLSLSWLEPPQARRLLEDAGFTIEACFGDFRSTPFAKTTATEQVWVARRPA